MFLLFRALQSSSLYPRRKAWVTSKHLSPWLRLRLIWAAGSAWKSPAPCYIQVKCCQVSPLTLVLHPRSFPSWQLSRGICGTTLAASPCQGKPSWCHFPIAQQQHWRSYSPLGRCFQMLVATVSFSSLLQTSLLFLKSSKNRVLLLLLLSLHSSSNKAWVTPATHLAFLIASFLLFFILLLSFVLVFLRDPGGSYAGVTAPSQKHTPPHSC